MSKIVLEKMSIGIYLFTFSCIDFHILLKNFFAQKETTMLSAF